MPNSTVTEEDIAPFNSITAILVRPLVNLTDRPNRALYIFFTIALFTLTSAFNIVEIFWPSADSATMLGLHRCYVIWGSSKWIAFPLIFVMLLLATGRIWWISREARKHMGPAIKTKYNIIVAIILESGILYPIFLTTSTIYALLADPDAHGIAPFSVMIVTYQVAGIAPTLIIIRAAGGKTVEHTSMNQVVSSLHFANGAGPGPENSDTRSHIQVVDVEARSSAGRIQNPDWQNSA
ncbi:hypothetical protein WG66_004208 [Moniliophthora roreri]|nr:hypothetical protein WG66_004208 [Moniliophthora roreri]